MSNELKTIQEILNLVVRTAGGGTLERVASVQEVLNMVYDPASHALKTSGAGTGDVAGPGSATDGNLAAFDGVTGKLLKEFPLGTEGYILQAGASGPTYVAQGTALAKSVAGSSDWTMSAAEAGNPTLILTGLLTGSINVIIPAVAMVRTFHNKTTGAYTVNVKTSAGAACLVPQNQAVSIICDGTDCLNLNNLMGVWTNAVVYNVGSANWTVPNGITRCHVRIWGGGGGGGGSDVGGRKAGGGGGGGGYAEGFYSGLTPGGTIAYVVGAGGAGGLNGTNGSTGATSSLGAPISISATGGGGGVAGDLTNPGAGGAGGAGSGGTIANLSGGVGGRANTDATAGFPGGPGGAAAYSGACGVAQWAVPGSPGAKPGGGAGGIQAGNNGQASAGGAGYLIIMY